MNVIVLGGKGFLGTNLVNELIKLNCNVTVANRNIKEETLVSSHGKLRYKNIDINSRTNFDELLEGNDIVFHLISSTVPTTSNRSIPDELEANVIMTSKMLDACIRVGVNKVIFLSSGGTVYGIENNCPLKEETPTHPISSYGIQKITIEELLYLYKYMYGLSYKVIRLSNPYGPYQKPNGIQGVIATLLYRALKNEQLVVWGDGSVIRDFIYVDDAVRGIINLATNETKYDVYNLGSGIGTSINEIINTMERLLEKKLDVIYTEGRKVDVPVNFLDISRYRAEFIGDNVISLECGIERTVEYMKGEYHL